MKAIFEEYGKVIIAIIAIVALCATIFGGIQIYKVMGNEMNVDTDISHSKSEDAVKVVSNRVKPNIYISESDDLHLFVNQVFKPVETVSCYDADGNALDVIVTSILFIDNSDGSQVELVGDYDKVNDKLDIPTVLTKPGVLAVTYKAIDSYNVTASKTISYVVDAVES